MSSSSKDITKQIPIPNLWLVEYREKDRLYGAAFKKHTLIRGKTKEDVRIFFNLHIVRYGHTQYVTDEDISPAICYRVPREGIVVEPF